MIKTLIAGNPEFKKEAPDTPLFLEVAEFFMNTIQGEGINIGHPAAFLRMQHCTMNCVWCFHPNTKVLTYRNGQKKIKDIKKGDILLTLDKRENIVETTVQETMKRSVSIENHLLKIETDNKKDKPLVVTKNHSLFVKGKGWTEAKDIKQGDILISVEGQQIVTNITDEFSSKSYAALFGDTAQKETEVYNLSCFPYNMYLANGVLAHNCDTQEVWRYGNPYTFEELFYLIEEHGLDEKLRNGQHLVLTGGSPLKQQTQLANFLKEFGKRFKFIPYIEVENECTIMPSNDMITFVDCWNNSPKLSNSGNLDIVRYQPKILTYLSYLNNSWFKFVITNDEDWHEIEKDFIKTDYIRRNQIILMPQGATREELHANQEKVVEIAVREGVRYCSRQHVELWDKKTGV